MAIECLVDHIHPTFTQLLSYLVVGDGLADHWAEILVLGAVQVNEGSGVISIWLGQFAKNPVNTQNA